ncbi:MAG TPA: hypothetical protein VJT09_04905 [Pyrinomonadaceae bacterium]|nr:hypothetical protein [Pyrinomonadaceae bacterium]
MGLGKRVGLLHALCCAVAVAFFLSGTEARGQSSQHISGTIVGISGRAAGRSRPFTLIVNRYTTPGQVRELNDALQSGGQDALLRVLSGMDAGRVQLGTGVGVTANAVIADPWGEGGTKLTVFYERNISFYELRYGARSENYRIGYAEIFLDRNGKGEGTFIPAARVRLREGNTWEVEDFGVFPARLIGLRSRGRVPAR